MRIPYRTSSVIVVGLLAAAMLFGPAGQAALIERDGQTLELRFNPAATKNDKAKVQAWVNNVAQALTTVYGEWPKDFWRVDVTVLPWVAGGPVPWAHVERHRVNSVQLYINGSASEAALTKDWTAYHEFSHLLIPYRGWGDLWFSEGLASYYQNVLQVRSGMLDEKAFWMKLIKGFERGMNNNPAPQESLRELSGSMRRNGGYFRVYWSGAWYFLSLDVKLRQLTQHRQSLDTVLAALKACCAQRSMSAYAIAAKMDTLAGVELFLPAFHDARKMGAMPDYMPLLTELGIEKTHRGIALRNDASSRRLRAGIVAGRPQAAVLAAYDR